MIRELTFEQDFDSVVDICYAFSKEGHYKDMEGRCPDMFIKYVISWFNSECSTLLGCFDGDNLLGFICVDIVYTYYKKPIGNFSHFIVSPKYRNGDVSKRLIEKAVEICDNAKCIEVYAVSTGIEGERQNRLFVRFMKRYGFDSASTMLKRIGNG